MTAPLQSRLGAGPTCGSLRRLAAAQVGAGFAAAEVEDGLPHLIEEFRQRPWLLATNALWDDERSRLVVIVESDGSDPRIQGGVGGANFDEVWDCVNACFNFASDGIHFDIEASEVV